MELSKDNKSTASMKGAAQKLPKKKKKSLFDEDDFFVIKKAKKSKSSELQKPANSIDQESVKEIPTQLRSPQLPVISSSIATPDDDVQQFYSADESMRTPIDVEELLASPKTPVTRARKTQSVPSPLRPKKNDFADLDIEDDIDLKDFISHLSKDSKDDALSRVYRVKIISKIPPFHTIEKDIRGDYTFEQLLEYVKMDRVTRREKSKDTALLIWVEGRTELKRYFKPSTLRISAPSDGEITRITCLYIPAEHANNYEFVYSEFLNNTVDSEPEHDVDDLLIEIEDEDEPRASLEAASIPSAENVIGESIGPQGDAFLVIGLKGKDNKRIDVEVSSQTPIRKLLEHYISEKGINAAEAKNARLMFDSEELLLDDLVGDTELEEDFEVEVYI